MLKARRGFLAVDINTGIRAVIKDSVYETGFIVPLTFKSKIPQGWIARQVKATQNSNPIEVRTVSNQLDKIRILVNFD